MSGPAADGPGATSSPGEDRRYPTRPIVGVGAAVFNASGEVLLVRRRFEPLAGEWSLPGGGLETGETLQAGTAREVLEETGLAIEVGPMVEAFDRILLDEQGNVRYHFVLVDYLCRPTAGTPMAGSDVSACAWVAPDRLGEFHLADKTLEVIRTAQTVRTTLGW